MQDLKARISLAAQDLFLERGIEGVSMRKIAQRVGVTAPAIYRHYRDKGELLNEIIKSGLQILEGYLRPALEADEPFDRLRGLLDAYLEFGIQEPKYFDFAFLIPSHETRQLPEELERHNWRTFAVALEQISVCMKRGVLRPGDPMQTAIVLWSTAHGMLSLHRMNRFGVPDEAFRQIYHGAIDGLLAALRPPQDD